MKPEKDQSKYLSAWKYVEGARYVPSLSRVIRDKKDNNPLVIDYSDVDAYSDKHANTRNIYFCMAIQQS